MSPLHLYSYSLRSVPSDLDTSRERIPLVTIVQGEGRANGSSRGRRIAASVGTNGVDCQKRAIRLSGCDVKELPYRAPSARPLPVGVHEPLRPMTTAPLSKNDAV